MDIKQQIQDDITKNKVVIYMKGTPDSPMCGFSAQAVSILKTHNAKFLARDILENPELRQGVKEFTDWPTIPQIFINGEFIGGCDIIIEMESNGELTKLLG